MDKEVLAALQRTVAFASNNAPIEDETMSFRRKDIDIVMDWMIDQREKMAE